MADQAPPAVSVIGLGHMGSALAGTLVDAGHPTTVWNRSTAKADAFAKRGASVAASPAEAIAASPVTIVSLLDYDAVRGVLADADVKAAAAGRTLVNLTSGGPEEGRALAELVAGLAADYLDGNID